MTLINIPQVDAATEQLLERGVRVFNGALFGPTEADHVAVLLDALDPPEGALVIDMGCGVGEMARLMHEARPDLEFLLVNISEAQLAECPAEMDKLLADFDRLGAIPDHAADAVIFSFALCHSEFWPTTLAEAYRVLKPGGTLLINDMARVAGDDAEFTAVLGASVHPPEFATAWLNEAGFRIDDVQSPEVFVDRLRDTLDADGVEVAMLDGIAPMLWRCTALAPEAARWVRHKGRIAFQFSGGRDSTAALYMLRDQWPLMRVFHLDTGDQFPETKAVVKRVEIDLAEVGVELERIVTSVQAVRDEFGISSDIVPVDFNGIGTSVSGATLRVIGRYECCSRALMIPMHQTMIDEGITLLVRGTRDDEFASPLVRDGDALDGFEAHYPIGAWTAADVDAYIAANDLPVAPYYADGMKRAPECMHCTAWWDEGRARYLRANHPAVHAVVMTRLIDIKRAVAAQHSWLTNELEA